MLKALNKLLNAARLQRAVELFTINPAMLAEALMFVAVGD
jgi:hypothetical protein